MFPPQTEETKTTEIKMYVSHVSNNPISHEVSLVSRQQNILQKNRRKKRFPKVIISIDAG